MIQQYADIKSRFDEYYWRKIYPLMIEKEKVRQKYLAAFKRIIIISCIVPPIVIYLLWYCANKYDKEWIVDFIYFAMAINAYILRAPYAKYKSKVKNDIMSLFINFFDGFSYRFKEGLTHYEIKDNYIFPDFDKIEADDCFYGSYNEVNIRICEEKLLKYRKNNKHGKYESVFRGIVLEIDMNKNFEHHTFVVKDKGMFNRFHIYSGFERVALEDVVFEKDFEAYSQNQIEARYLLTTAFMERMLKLKELYKGKDIQFSFNDSKVMIAINTKQNMFEPCSLFKSNLQEGQIYNVFEQFITIFSVIEVLKLNQKIGM